MLQSYMHTPYATVIYAYAHEQAKQQQQQHTNNETKNKTPNTNIKMFKKINFQSYITKSNYPGCFHDVTNSIIRHE